MALFVWRTRQIRMFVIVFNSGQRRCEYFRSSLEILLRVNVWSALSANDDCLWIGKPGRLNVPNVTDMSYFHAKKIGSDSETVKGCLPRWAPPSHQNMHKQWDCLSSSSRGEGMSALPTLLEVSAHGKIVINIRIREESWSAEGLLIKLHVYLFVFAYNTCHRDYVVCRSIILWNLYWITLSCPVALLSFPYCHQIIASLFPFYTYEPP